jgi:hypothetical protein
MGDGQATRCEVRVNVFRSLHFTLCSSGCELVFCHNVSIVGI